MNRTERTLTDVAKQIEKDFLLIGLPTSLENFLTSEEYETFRFALKGILQDNYNKHWEVMDRINKKVDKIAAEAPALFNAMCRKESLNPKLRFIGFETSIFDLLFKKVNEFISSDECGEFIDFDFKVTEHNHHFVYSGFVKYRAPAHDEDKTKHVSNDVKEFASEVRKTIEDTAKNLGSSEHCNFADYGLTLIEAVQNKLSEVLK